MHLPRVTKGSTAIKNEWSVIQFSYYQTHRTLSTIKPFNVQKFAKDTWTTRNCYILSCYLLMNKYATTSPNLWFKWRFYVQTELKGFRKIVFLPWEQPTWSNKPYVLSCDFTGGRIWIKIVISIYTWSILQLS